jgi:hypothetical protein
MKFHRQQRDLGHNSSHYAHYINMLAEHSLRRGLCPGDREELILNKNSCEALLNQCRTEWKMTVGKLVGKSKKKKHEFEVVTDRLPKIKDLLTLRDYLLSEMTKIIQQLKQNFDLDLHRRVCH